MGLTVLKLTAAFLSGSVGVLSEGIHSFLDLVSASLAFFTVREAGKPADEDHPFGHGKIETLSSLFESLLLLLAAGLIIFEGIEQASHPKPLRYQGLAIATIFLSIAVSYIVYRHNRQASLVTESPALHVNSLHFLSDVVASFGVLLGLLILKFTGWIMIDAIMAFAVAIYILVVSAQGVRKAIYELSDRQLPTEEIARLKQIIDSFKDSDQGSMIEAHDLRTRKSGATRHLDFHLVCCGQMTVDESHEICDGIESKILGVFSDASVNIHVEPCEQQKTQCHLRCPIFKARKNVKSIENLRSV